MFHSTKGLFSVFTDYTEEPITTQRTPPQPTPTADHDNNLSIILPMAFFFLLVIVVCVIVFVLWRRRQENDFDIMSEPGFSMRDKLRTESLKSLDTLLLRHYDPNKLRQYRLDRVQYVKELGVGSFGKVFQGMFNLSQLAMF